MTAWSDALRKTRLRALCSAGHYSVDNCCGDWESNAFGCQRARDLVIALEAADAEHGAVTVPREPIREQKIAGCSAIVRAIEAIPAPYDEAAKPIMVIWMGNSKVTDAVYEAYLSAALGQEKTDE